MSDYGGDYANIDWLKDKLKIDDEDEDEDLMNAVEAANRFTEDLVTIHAETVPLTDEQKKSAEGVANAEAMRDYKLTKLAIDASKEWRYVRDERVKALIAVLSSDPTNSQNDVVAVSSTYRSEPLKSRSL